VGLQIPGLHLVNKPKVQYPLVAEKYAAQSVPSLEEWDQLWAAWDAVTLEMIPEEELLEKPIKLRNACIFYLGHIPTFMDIHLTRATQGKPTEPSSYPSIFERGIDPDVDDPEQCHAHSEIPDSWPPTSEILDFSSKVRIRVKKLYASGQATKDRTVARALWLSYEHEIMHLETLLYMLVQSEKTMAPPTTVMPDFQALATQARQGAVENQWFDIPAQGIEIGLEDPDDNSGPEHFFGWDNEKPKRTVQVPAFKAQGRPITNGEYVKYLEENHIDTLPASWQTLTRTNGVESGDASSAFLDGKAVRTVYGPISLKLALDWPVCASYDEVAGCARWMGGRIPTMEEARSIYHYVHEAKAKAHETLGANIPAVNASVQL
jgi:formylglycine-generating enzyme required for sulfatase activity